MKTPIKRYTKMTLVEKGKPIFDESVFTLEIDDEAAGEFLVVRSLMEGLDYGEIKIDPCEWPALRDAIDTMIGYCQDHAP